MALRFFAKIQTSLAARDTSSQLEMRDIQQVFEARRLSAYSDTSSETFVLPGWGGVVFGTLFTRSESPVRATSFSHDEADLIRRTSGRHLIHSYWGAYVAFVVDLSTRAIHVLRDPSGALPCYYSDTGNEILLASDVDTLFSCSALKPTIQWRGLLRHLLAPDLRTEDTALDGVMELRPGFSLISEGRRVEQAERWSPWNHVTAPIARTELKAVEALQETLITCHQAWASRFSQGLLGVSGGLDSSISAALLSPHMSLTLLTMATRDPSGDERRYARILASHLQAPLVEAFYDLADSDLEKTTTPHLPLPIGTPIGHSGRRHKASIAAEKGVDAYFSGAGGDNVFCLTQSAGPFLDRLLAEGIGRNLWTTVIDICRLNGCSIWDVFRQAHARHQKGVAYRWQGDPIFLAPEQVEAIGPLSHPWLEAPRGALPGKATHIATLLRMQVSPDFLPRRTGAPQILPLMSQPIVEQCLSIPSWQWVSGGQNRSIARQAADSWLPQELLRRRSKGGPSSFAYKFIEHCRHELPERLLQGKLAKAGLLDLPALERTLADPRPFAIEARMRLTQLLEAEAWVKHWQTQGDAFDARQRTQGPAIP